MRQRHCILREPVMLCGRTVVSRCPFVQSCRYLVLPGSCLEAISADHRRSRKRECRKE